MRMEPTFRIGVLAFWALGCYGNGGRVPDERDKSKMIEQSPPRRRGDAALDEARLRQQAIGVKLRQIFDEVVNEPVPDEFLDILRRADRQEPGKD